MNALELDQIKNILVSLKQNAKKRSIIKYVLITLYVDEKTPLPETLVVNENGQDVKLRTVGDRWSYLQRSKFGANAQPFYVALDNEGKPLTGSAVYDEDIKKYVDFLKAGLENYRK